MRIQFIRAALTAWLSMVVTVMIYIERFIYMIYMLPQYKSCPLFICGGDFIRHRIACSKLIAH